MQPSLSVRAMPPVLLMCVMSIVGFAAEPIVLESSAVNTVQIKAIMQRGTKVFEIQLGGGSNQPPADTWITGKASTVIGQRRYSGLYRISTDPEHQLKMQPKSATENTDEYGFVDGNDILYFEFAPNSSFRNPWLTGRISLASASQQVHDAGRRRKCDQNSENQNGNQCGNQNNGGQNNGDQNNGDQNDGDQHPPIAMVGKMSAPTGGSLAKLFGPGECQLVLDVGGNQQLSVLQQDNTLSGMSLQQGGVSLKRQ